MITLKQQDMIDAAKAFLIEFEETLSGTTNPMLNRMVAAAINMRQEILGAEEGNESEQDCIGGFLRQVIKSEHEIRYGESVCVRNDQPFMGFIGE